MTGSRLRMGVILAGILCVLALLGPPASPYDPTAQPRAGELLALQNNPPSWSHPFGTDFYGRDVLTRVLYATRLSLAIGMVAVLVSLTVGAAVGVTAGLAGGFADAALMRAVDTGLAVPRVLLLLVIVALWASPGTFALILILGLTSWFETSRIVRAQVLAFKAGDSYMASRALGIPALRLVVRHILPNVRAPILVAGTLAVANIIVLEAGLSFLGFSIAPPTATLGNMLHESHDLRSHGAYWTALAPGTFLFLIALGFFLLEDGLRQRTDRLPAR